MKLERNIIYYRFNSTNAWSNLKMASLITLRDLESHISSCTTISDCNHTNKEVSCSCQFQLAFFDSISKYEIRDKNKPLHRNSHIIVKRYPINMPNIQRIEKKIVLSREQEALKLRQRKEKRVREKEISEIETRKELNVRARLKELEDERWERARFAHEQEVARLKQALAEKKKKETESKDKKSNTFEIRNKDEVIVLSDEETKRGKSVDGEKDIDGNVGNEKTISDQKKISDKQKTNESKKTNSGAKDKEKTKKETNQKTKKIRLRDKRVKPNRKRTSLRESKGDAKLNKKATDDLRYKRKRIKVEKPWTKQIKEDTSKGHRLYSNSSSKQSSSHHSQPTVCESSKVKKSSATIRSSHVNGSSRVKVSSHADTSLRYVVNRTVPKKSSRSAPVAERFISPPSEKPRHSFETSYAKSEKLFERYVPKNDDYVEIF